MKACTIDSWVPTSDNHSDLGNLSTSDSVHELRAILGDATGLGIATDHETYAAGRFIALPMTTLVFYR
jgi:hypothetical protein